MRQDTSCGCSVHSAMGAHRIPWLFLPPQRFFMRDPRLELADLIRVKLFCRTGGPSVPVAASSSPPRSLVLPCASRRVTTRCFACPAFDFRPAIRSSDRPFPPARPLSAMVCTINTPSASRAKGDYFIFLCLNHDLPWACTARHRVGWPIGTGYGTWYQGPGAVTMIVPRYRYRYGTTCRHLHC